MNITKQPGKMCMMFNKKNHNRVKSAPWLHLQNRWAYWQGTERNKKWKEITGMLFNWQSWFFFSYKNVSYCSVTC